MLSEELRERLGLLNRRQYISLASAFTARPADLASLVPGEVVHDASGQFYRVRRNVTQLNAASLAELVQQHVAPIEFDEKMHPELHAFGQAFPDRAVFLDLETCGFSGSPLFLVGMLRRIDGSMVVEQLLARNYAEEPAVLHYLWRTLRHYDVLVSFNGKSFDWPFIRDRSVAHRLTPPDNPSYVRNPGHAGSEPRGTDEPFTSPSTHCDLLHLARKYWKRKHELPNCKLQTLESVLCGRHRYGDIPGYLIGPVYHRFVRSGDARQVEQVLHHNAVDLITLAQLALMMVREAVEAVGAVEEVEAVEGVQNRTDLNTADS